ncbi:MAG: PadR family transcriptional regulator [Solirubrobacterales bacterium]
MELSGTATVILGMLAARPRSGYDVKQLVDNSTRFFWAASYGQIYPELKRLAEAGLIKATDSPQGGRRRTVYGLTTKGERAVREWFGRPAEVFELRDEGLLKLFFAGVLDPGRAPEVVRERGARSAEIAQRLQGIERQIEAKVNEGPAYSADTPSRTVLRFGIEMNEWIAEWCERTANDFEDDATAKPAAAGRRG